EKYGADALRFTLAILTQQGRDIKLSEKRFEGYKHFANKLWNAGRFILMNLEEDLLSNLPYGAPPRSEDLWIITRLNRAIEKVNKALESYEFSEAARELYEFIWSEFCDWYIELSKLRLYAKAEGPEEEQRVKGEKITAQATLLMVFERILRLLHPFMPYITEELWLSLPTAHKESISLTEYPQFNPQEIYLEAEKKVERLKEIITSIRSLRSDLRIEPSRRIKLYYKAEESKELVEEFMPHIVNLARLESLELVEDKPPRSVAGFSRDFEFYLPVEEGVKVEELITSYEKRLSEVEKSIKAFENRLNNESFLRRAPEEEIQRTKESLEELKVEKNKIEKLLKALKEVI
ncbi:MAG: class I tRNA ligase family protein, partial [Aquificaceae bacterium]